MMWRRVLAFDEPLPCAAALLATAPAEILPNGKGRRPAENVIHTFNAPQFP